MKPQIKFAAVCALLVISFTACAMLQPQLPQTPQDTSTFFMSYYMAQMRDYTARYAAASQSDVVAAMEAEILMAKYEFLTRAWEPIALYDSYVTSGAIPPATLEAEINALILSLENSLKEGRK